jgi:glycine hydroxymethyltransferase
MALIAGDQFQDPLKEGAGVISGSTQKSFPGPIGGLVMTKDPELGTRISATTARLLPTYPNNSVLALGIALAEMAAFGNGYISACISNAKVLANRLAERGFHPICADRDYTMSNQVILDVSDRGPALDLTRSWEAASIITSPMELPAADSGGGRPATGVRLGSQEVTRLGMGADEMTQIADLMRRVADGDRPEAVKADAAALAMRFGTVYYCFEAPYPPSPPGQRGDEES